MKFLLTFFCSILIFISSHAKEKTVNIYSWSSYISPNTIKNFEKKFGIKVNYDVFDSNEILDAKLLAGKTGYDIVFPSDNPFLKNQINLGIYKKLDKDKLPNITNIDELFLNIMSQEDPGNKYAIPWLWGLTGIGINKKKILEIDPEAPLDSLNLIFNPEYAKKFAKCGINLLDSATEVIPFALIYNGFNPNSQNFAELEIAKETLATIRPYIKTFNSSTYDDSFVDDSICIGISWSGDIVKAEEKLKHLNKSNNLKFILPKEGFLMSIDAMAIPTDAPNTENAYHLINYLMDPKIAAENSNFTKYFNANKESYKYINKAMQANRPSETLIKKGYRIDPHPAKLLRRINRIWTGIITESY